MTTTYKTILDFKEIKKMKMKNILKESDKLELNLTFKHYKTMKHYDNVRKLFSKEVKQKTNFIGCYFDITKIFNHNSEEVYTFLKNIQYEKITKPYCTDYINLFDEILKSISNKKTVFICLDIYGYGHNVEETDEDADKYDLHSIMLVLTPISNYNYRFIVINSHGNDITYEYETVITRKRVRKTKYKRGIDFEVINIFQKNLARYVKERKNKIYRDLQISFSFNDDKKHCYKGSNLQIGDSYGYCYLYPIMLYSYFLIYFNKERFIDNLKVDTVENMLKHGDIIKFVHSCVADFCTPFKQLIIESNNSQNSRVTKKLDLIIYNQDYRLFKTLGTSVIKFVNQFKV